MRGGHSCPPLLLLQVRQFGIYFAVFTSPQNLNRVKIKVNGGGQECPPHTRHRPFVFFRALRSLSR